MGVLVNSSNAGDLFAAPRPAPGTARDKDGAPEPPYGPGDWSGNLSGDRPEDWSADRSGYRPGTDAPPTVTIAAAGRIHDGITELICADSAAVSAAGALSLLEELGRERRRLDAAYLRAVAIADQTDAVTAVRGGPATLQGFLKSTVGISPGRAKADLAAARAVHGERSKELTPTARLDTGALRPMGDLLAEGQTSLAHLDVGVKTLENIPERLVSAENVERIGGFLADQSTSTTPHQIRGLSDRLIRSLEPGRDDHYDPESFNRRSFTMATDITGMVHGSYQLDPEAGAELRAIMDPLAAPKPGQKNENGDVVARDTRTPAQRRADAFSELVRAGSTYLGPATPAIPTEDGTSPGKFRPVRRQNRITILTTMDQIKSMRNDTGRGGDGFTAVDPTDSHCDQTGPVTSGALARMSCDALFERVVLDAKGAVLDLGLPVRLASPAQRRALAARDRGCIAPGCDRPPSWTEAHHVQWYSRGGPTDVSNMCLACPADHSRIHSGQLEVKMIDGIPYARPAPGQGAGASIPIGSIRHPEHTDWVRNGYFDKLKTAENAARAIVISTNQLAA